MHLLVFNLKTDSGDSVLGFTTDWLNALAAQCEQVTVITMCKGKLNLNANVRVLSVGKERGLSEFSRALEFYRLLFNVLSNNKIDACFAHMMPLFAVMGWPLLRSRNIPIVLWYAHGHVSILLRVATALVDKVVASSPSGFRIRTNKFIAIGQGINTERFSPSNGRVAFCDEKLRFITIGRISPIKRIEISIDAFGALPDDICRNIEFSIVGSAEGEESEEYERGLRKRAAAFKHIKFENSVPFSVIEKQLQQSDVFINCSDTDSLDKAVLEAMSCGLPIITSNYAFHDIFESQAAKRWVIEKNNVSALTDRIVEMYSMSKEERKEIGDSNRRIVTKEHSLPSLAARIIKIIQSMQG